jgi:hypothetical protein
MVTKLESTRSKGVEKVSEGRLSIVRTMRMKEDVMIMDTKSGKKHQEEDDDVVVIRRFKKMTKPVKVCNQKM